MLRIYRTENGEGNGELCKTEAPEICIKFTLNLQLSSLHIHMAKLIEARERIIIKELSEEQFPEFT